IALGRELERRGHEVRLAVSPDLVGFVESSGLTAIAYGPNTQEWVDKYRDFFKSILLNMWKPRDLIELLAPKAEDWVEMTKKVLSLADGGDLLYPGLNFDQPAANVAEYYRIPLATLHYYPMRPNG